MALHLGVEIKYNDYHKVILKVKKQEFRHRTWNNKLSVGIKFSPSFFRCEYLLCATNLNKFTESLKANDSLHLIMLHFFPPEIKFMIHNIFWSSKIAHGKWLQNIYVIRTVRRFQNVKNKQWLWNTCLKDIGNNCLVLHFLVQTYLPA